MKNTLTKILLGISLTFMSINVSAQEGYKDNHHPKHTPEMMLNKLDSELNLNETQEKRIITLLEQNFSRRKEIKSNHKKIKEKHRIDIKSKLSKVLTKDQMVKFVAMHDHRKESHKTKANKKDHHRDDMKRSKRLDKMTKELNLSDKQQVEVKEIFDAKKDEIKLKKEYVKSLRHKMKTNFDKDMKAILTPEQYSKYIILKKNHLEVKKVHGHKH